MQRDDSYLVDILTAIHRIETFIHNVDFNQFLENPEKCWAIVSQIAIIGEAANHLTGKFKHSHPEIPWQEITGMRNRVIHGYDQINWQLIWETIQRDLPPLKKFIEQRNIGKSEL